MAKFAAIVPIITAAAKGALIGAGIGAVKGAITGQPIGASALAGAKFGGITGGVLGTAGQLASRATMGAKLASANISSSPLSSLAKSGYNPAAAVASGGSGLSLGSGGVLSNMTVGQKLASNFQGMFNKQGTVGSKGGFSLGSLGGDALKKLGIPLGFAGLAGAFGPKPQTSFNYDPVDAYKNIRTYVGDSALKSNTSAELNKYVSMPLKDLAGSFNFGNDRTMRKLNEAFDKQKADIQRSAAQMGQSALNSSDVQKRLQEIEMNRATAIAETEQELSNYAMTQAIQQKQNALGNALSQNQFDDNLAMELADLVGQKEALEFAIRSGDVNTFQKIMSQILSIGLGYEGAGAMAGV